MGYARSVVILVRQVQISEHMATRLVETLIETHLFRHI